jgi:plastocyanin
MKTTRFTLVAALAALALAAVGCGGGDEGAGDTTTTDTTTTETTPTGSTISGSVGPGFDISMSTADGQPLDSVEAGSYALEVEDLSSAHNFHLTGPGGVDVSTDVAAEGTETFQVDLQAGTYSFVCNPHASTMNGSFEVSG